MYLCSQVFAPHLRGSFWKRGHPVDRSKRGGKRMRRSGLETNGMQGQFVFHTTFSSFFLKLTWAFLVIEPISLETLNDMDTKQCLWPVWYYYNYIYIIYVIKTETKRWMARRAEERSRMDWREGRVEGREGARRYKREQVMANGQEEVWWHGSHWKVMQLDYENDESPIWCVRQVENQCSASQSVHAWVYRGEWERDNQREGRQCALKEGYSSLVFVTIVLYFLHCFSYTKECTLIKSIHDQVISIW